MIEEDHRLLLVWNFVDGLELSELYDQIKSVEGLPGSPAIDPKILMAVWLYAILDHEISARRIADFCEKHSAYIWLCGGVKINHHTLSDFYTAHEQWLNKQFTRNEASLKHQGLVDLDRVAQDFIQVRACAGADSFLCCETLESCLKEADEYLEKLRKEREENPAEVDKRKRAAHERAARERSQRVREALRQLPEVEAKKKKEEDRKKARVSTTDPDARVMKMPDGGAQTAFNVQLSTDTSSQIIVGIDVAFEVAIRDNFHPCFRLFTNVSVSILIKL